MCFAAAQDVERFVRWHVDTYPQSRLLDIYKSCFQDYMGAEHMLGDTASVKAYLDYELAQIDTADTTLWLYEPCGIEGNYVRVNLMAVKAGLLAEDVLLDAFIRTANGAKRPAVEVWRERWGEIVAVIDAMSLNLPYYIEDKQSIDELLAKGKYAISHSLEYREAYRPHYRIVERAIFESEIKPLIEKHKSHQNSLYQ